MINSKDLRQLAELIVSDNKAGRDVTTLVNKLNPKELRRFLSQLKNAIARHRVYVRTADEPGKELKDMMNRRYPGREIIYESSSKLGAGIEILDNDNVIKMNIKNMMDKKFEQLRENL